MKSLAQMEGPCQPSRHDVLVRRQTPHMRQHRDGGRSAPCIHGPDRGPVVSDSTPLLGVRCFISAITRDADRAARRRNPWASSVMARSSSSARQGTAPIHVQPGLRDQAGSGCRSCWEIAAQRSSTPAARARVDGSAATATPSRNPWRAARPEGGGALRRTTSRPRPAAPARTSRAMRAFPSPASGPPWIGPLEADVGRVELIFLAAAVDLDHERRPAD